MMRTRLEHLGQISHQRLPPRWGAVWVAPMKVASPQRVIPFSLGSSVATSSPWRTGPYQTPRYATRWGGRSGAVQLTIHSRFEVPGAKAWSAWRSRASMLTQSVTKGCGERTARPVRGLGEGAVSVINWVRPTVGPYGTPSCI